MHDLLLLSRVLLKNNYTPLARKGKKRSLALQTLLMVVVELPFAILFYFQFNSLFSSGLTTLGLQAGYLMTSLLSLFTVLFAFPSVFYFSRDISFLLPLPVASWTIVGAKFIVVLMSQAMLVLTILLPMCAAWIVNGCGSFLQSLLVILQSFIVPLDAMLVLGILTILVMAFLPGTINKDRFNLIIGVFTIFMAVGISMLSSSAGTAMSSEESSQELILMLTENPQLMEMSTGLFFQCLLAVRSIGVTAPSLFWTLISLLVLAGLGGLFVLLAARFYIPSASAAMMKSSSSRKKGTSVQSSASRSYLLTRFRLIVRTPAYVTNLLLSALMMPFILLVMSYVLPTFQELKDITRSLDINAFTPPWSLLLLLGLAFGFFLGGTSGICGTSFSRDGQNLSFYKTIPMSMKEQIRLRLLVGFLPSFLSSLLMILVLHQFILYNPLWDLLFALGLAVTTLIVNQIGLLIDASHPKLVWEDETASVKNNYNVLYELFLSWIVLAVICVPTIFLIQVTPWASVVALGLCVIASVILEQFLENNGVDNIMKA